MSATMKKIVSVLCLVVVALIVILLVSNANHNDATKAAEAAAEKKLSETIAQKDKDLTAAVENAKAEGKAEAEAAAAEALAAAVEAAKAEGKAEAETAALETLNAAVEAAKAEGKAEAEAAAAEAMNAAIEAAKAEGKAEVEISAADLAAAIEAAKAEGKAEAEAAAAEALTAAVETAKAEAKAEAEAIAEEALKAEQEKAAEIQKELDDLKKTLETAVEPEPVADPVPAVMSYAEYDAAELHSEVTVETYVQDKQSWWADKATIYCQSEDGAYFIYELPISKEDYDKLTPGTKIKVKGYKSEYAGEVEIQDATFEIIEGEPFIATPEDVTALLGNDDLIKNMNKLVSFKGMTVEAYDETGAAFAYKDPVGKTDDLYFKVSKDGVTYGFCVEFYLRGNDTDVYKAVEALKVGDVIDLEGYLYWYNGVNPHIISVTVVEPAPAEKVEEVVKEAEEKVEEVKEEVKEAAEEVKEEVKEAVEEAKEDADKAVAVVADKAEEVVKEAEEKVEEVKEEVKEAVEEVKEEVKEAAEEAKEEAAAPAEEAAPAVMSYAEYDAAEMQTEVTVETYVQAKQTWWDGVARIYCQSEDGAYFLYDMPISQEDYDKLVPGTKIRVKGYKAEWAGEVEITEATFEIIEGEAFIAEAEDVTALLGTDDLVKSINKLVAFKGMTVEANDETGAAFAYKDPVGKTDDLYFKASKDGVTYSFCVESSLCGNDTEVYKAVEALKVGDVIDLEGYLYWYNGANPHIISVKAAE